MGSIETFIVDRDFGDSIDLCVLCRYYQYDLVNNRTQGTDRNGRITRYDYDNLNRVKSETWVGGGRVFTYTYDKNSNLLSADDGNIRYQYAYDQTDLLDRVDRIQAGNPVVSFEYTYDQIGNLTKAEESIANNIQATTLYEYNDPRYLNTKIIQTGTGLANKEVRFTYDAAGLNTKVERYVDGLLKVTTTNAFDLYGRLTGIEQKNGAGVFSNDVYDLDILSRLQTETVDGLSRSIVYDNTDQVKTVTGSNTEGYTYDKNGNRTRRTHNTTNVVDDYVWDYRNRLVSIVTTDAGGNVLKTVGYEYDVDDQRVKKTVDGVVENYYIDRNQIAFVTDGSGMQTFHYLYGLNVDAVMAQDSSAGMVWALADRLGSIDTLTDADGNVVNKRTFDSFGRVLDETNPSIQFRYGYTGRERDLESGLSYYRARYYDPNVGRFISVDPLGFAAGDTNLYRYVGNNSTNYTDPTGLFSLDDIGNFAYDRLVDTDKFVAGFAHLVTGGYTTQLRNEVYGDRVAGQHEGLLFNAGQVAGVGVSLALGFATPNALAGVGLAGRAAQGYAVTQAGIGAYNTTTKILDGKMDWSSPLSYLELAGSYAPAIGFGAKQLGKIGAVQNALSKATAVAEDLSIFARNRITDTRIILDSRIKFTNSLSADDTQLLTSLRTELADTIQRDGGFPRGFQKKVNDTSTRGKALISADIDIEGINLRRLDAYSGEPNFTSTNPRVTNVSNRYAKFRDADNILNAYVSAVGQPGVRNIDTEIKILEEVAQLTVQQPNVIGVIKFVGDRETCYSCQKVALDFLSIRPNIKLDFAYTARATGWKLRYNNLRDWASSLRWKSN